MVYSNIAGYAEEDFLADLLNITVDGIGSAADEVDDALSYVFRRRFKV